MWDLESRAYVLCGEMLGLIIRAVDLRGHRYMVPLQAFLPRDKTTFTGTAVERWILPLFVTYNSRTVDWILSSFSLNQTGFVVAIEVADVISPKTKLIALFH